MPKAYVSSFAISFGLMSTTGTLYPLVKTETNKASRMCSICPVCPTPTKVNQFFFCQGADRHGPFPPAELLKAKLFEDRLIPLSGEEIVEAKTSAIPTNTMEIAVHPRNEVWHNTFPAGTSYIFRPTSGDRFFGLLMDLLRDDSLAFIGYANIRHSEKLVQLTRWRDHIIVQQLLYPDDLEQVEPVAPPVNQNQTVYADLVASASTAFNVEDYANNVLDRIRALLAAKNNGEIPAARPVGTTTAPRVDDEESFLAMLTASLRKGA